MPVPKFIGGLAAIIAIAGLLVLAILSVTWDAPRRGLSDT
jgi:hypothetical protein